MFRETIVLGDDERAAGEREGAQRLVLVVLSGAQVGQRFVLGTSHATIGRDASVDIQL